jgi:uncharacterized protein
VRVLDEHRIAFGDLTGNNRLDSYRNLVEHPAVGMLFVVPGVPETVRINGRASISIDAELRERCAIEGRVPRVVVGVEVDECYVHCGAALRRGAVWDPTTWPRGEERPSAGLLIKQHAELDVTVAQIEQHLADHYDEGIWDVGGADR